MFNVSIFLWQSLHIAVIILAVVLIVRYNQKRKSKYPEGPW